MRRAAAAIAFASCLACAAKSGPPQTGSWKLMAVGPVLGPVSGPAHVWTGKEMLVWGRMPGLPCVDSPQPDPCIAALGGRYDPAPDQWQPITSASLPSALFGGRYGFAATIWTGKEMLIWGGRCDENVICDGGAAYDPEQDKWRAMSDLNGPPRGRSDYAAAWTGTKMIIWGGTDYNFQQQPVTLRPVGDGFAYDPDKDTWVSISSAGAPSANNYPAFTWTGSRMVIWGIGDQLQPEGALYDPIGDTWQRMSNVGAPVRGYQLAFWTGTEVLVWNVGGGGGLYDPATDKWRPISMYNAPQSPQGLPVVWTGTELLVWSADTGGPGGRYSPKTDQWGAMTIAGQPSIRRGAQGVWTGTEMIVWGGANSGLVSLGDGARFTP